MGALGVGLLLGGVLQSQEGPRLGATELQRVPLRVVEPQREGLGAAVELAERRIDREIVIPLERLRTGEAGTTSGVEVADAAGRDLTDAAQQRVVGGELRLSVPVEGQLVVRPSQVVTMRLPEERVLLPGGVVQPTEIAEEEHVWFRPTILASPLPVVWNASLRRYTTGLLLGLQLPPEAGALSLENPVTMRLGFRGMTAEPISDVTLTQPGLEHEQRVDLHFLPTTTSPVLELRSTLGNVDFEMDVLPRVELRPVAGAMRGFGFGSVAIDVVHLHPHGTEAPLEEDTIVSLEIGGDARVEPDQVSIPAGGASRRFVLHSSGLGPITVTATARGLTDSRTIEQTLPYLPFLAALLGGALGGYSRRFQKGAAEASYRARIVEGAVVAAVVYPALILGLAAVAIPAAIVATEAGAFVAGAVTGFAGVAVIEGLARRLRAVPT